MLGPVRKEICLWSVGHGMDHLKKKLESVAPLWRKDTYGSAKWQGRWVDRVARFPYRAWLALVHSSDPGSDPSFGPVLSPFLPHYERVGESNALSHGSECVREWQKEKRERKVCFFPSLQKQNISIALFPPLIKSKLLHDLLPAFPILSSTCMVSFCNFYKKIYSALFIFIRSAACGFLIKLLCLFLDLWYVFKFELLFWGLHFLIEVGCFCLLVFKCHLNKFFFFFCV